jgi:putative flippase GtrA
MRRVKSAFARKEARFLLVGGMNTAVGYGSYALLVFLGLPYMIAQAASTVVGTTHSYFWNKYFTFKRPRKSIREALRFVLVYASSYALNALILFVSVESLGANEYAAGCVCLAFTTAISYIGHNFFSFKNGNLTDSEQR